MKFIKEVNFIDLNKFLTLRQLLKEFRVVVVKNISKEVDLESFVSELGEIYPLDEDNLTGEKTGKKWIDITYNNTELDRYRTSNCAQPLHTDASYLPIHNNIQFLYCRSKAEKGGSTTFIESDEIVRLLELDERFDLLEKLKSTEVKHEKGGTSKVRPIIISEGGIHKFNWNYFPSRSQVGNDVNLVEEFHTFLQNRVVPSGLVSEILLESGDGVFFHDELILHGRNSYFAKFNGQRDLTKITIILNDPIS